MVKTGWSRCRSLFQTALENYFSRRALRRIRRLFPESNFIGPYERDRHYNGAFDDQWLWAHRDLIRGVVLDMSTPRYYHEFIYRLPSVKKVMISDLCNHEVKKFGHKSKVDIIGDFCASDLPTPEEFFDTVLCISILEHCEDPVAMVRNIGRVLRPGGVAFFETPFAYIDGHTGEMVPDYWRFCRDGYLLMARKVGMEVLEIGQFGDLGKYFVFEYGWSAAATSWHRGVPMVNWMICRRPSLHRNPERE